MPRIYMDYAATTQVDAEVLREMKPYFSRKFGNASSIHRFGREAKGALEEGRAKIAKALNANLEEIVFTGGGSESDNLAVKGAAYANRGKGNHIVTTGIEHHAVLNTCKYLEKQGFQITYLPVTKEGLVEISDVEKALTEKTILVSVMHANNEIGTIEPIKEIGKICGERGVIFHTDAVQTAGKIPTDVNELGVDMLSVSSHKLYGPKGVGALYVKKGTALDPIIHGGEHEKGMRAGTENISGIVGFGKAMEIAQARMDEDSERERALRDRLISGALKIEESHLNGHPTKRLPGNASFWFAYVEGESIVLRLDAKGIASSTGSACSSASLEPSYVLMAIGLTELEAHGSLRLTIGRWNTENEVDYVVEVLPPVIEKLRKMSPLGKGIELKFDASHTH
jgi:cysteine desulfurase